MANSVVILTHFPSPYQVELFNEVDRISPDLIKVFYLHGEHYTRSWTRPEVRHAAHFLDRKLAGTFVNEAFQTPDLAVMNFYAEQEAARLIRARAASGKPWVFWGERPGFKNRFLGRILRRFTLHRLIDKDTPIWGIGQWAVDAYRDEFGHQRTYVNMPYYSDLRRFENSVAQAPVSEFVFLFSGSLISRKGVDLLISAFLRLSENAPHVRLRIMGEGVLERTLRSQVMRSGNNQVEFLGFKDWNELPEIYASAHALCVPSRYDGWGMVVAEGLAAGLPVISTDQTGAAQDLISEGQNGFIVKAGDMLALGHAMRTASENRSQWPVWSRQARASVAQHSIDVGARRFVDALHYSLDRHG